MRALITGVSGQDGSFLAEHLAGLGYSVFGFDRVEPPPFLRPVLEKFILGTIVEWQAADEITRIAKPDEIYNLAAELNVQESWERPAEYINANLYGLLNVLWTAYEQVPEARIFQATSSDVFGNAPVPQNERTPVAPLNPYAVSKAAAHHLAQAYRAGYGVFIVSGILFPHSSPRQRGGVLRKIARAAVDIAAGRQDTLALGTDSVRDWGHAQDYVRAMHLALQQEEPWDYCIGTGVGRAVSEAARIALRLVGVDPAKHLRMSAEEPRPTDAPTLVADPARIKTLGWRPQVTFDAMMAELIEAERMVPVGV